MSDNAYALAAFGMGMVLTATFLTLGLWVGYKVGRATVAAASRPPARRRQRMEWLVHELDRCAALGQQVARESQALSGLASSGNPAKLQNLGSATRHLMQISADLRERLERLVGRAKGKAERPSASKASMTAANPGAGGLAKPASSTQRATAAGLADESHSSLSVQELGQITEIKNDQVESDDEMHRRRFSYDCVQSVFRWNPSDARLPKLSDGVTVRCHDISGHGISFFWPSEPDFEHLIISLGSDQELLFMAAQVMHFKPIDMHGVGTYLVGCRFIRRMNELTMQWSRELNCQSDANAESAEPALTA